MSGNRAMRRAVECKDAYRLEGVPILTFETVLVTPEMAQQFLSLDGANRPIPWGRVSEYVKEMKEGKFKLIPQPIIFDDKGRLLTGQQRLWAIVQSGTAQYVVVARGCPREYRELIDRGKPLSASDIACMRTGRAKKPFKIVEKQIAKGLCVLLDYKPTINNMAETMTLNEEMTSYIAEEMDGVGKTKASLMILAAICFLSKDKNITSKLLQKSELLAERLKQKVLPFDIEDCWKRGPIFKKAMQTAKEIVEMER